MKASPLHWLLCIGAMAGALWGLGMLRPESAKAESRSASRLGIHSADDPADPGKVVFRYFDFADALHEFECHVDPAFMEEERATFGYPVDEEANLAALDQQLIDEIRASAGPLARYARLKVTHEKASSPAHGIHWVPTLAQFQWSGDLPASARHKAAEIKARYFATEALSKVTARIFRDYLRSHGFELRESGDDGRSRKFSIDYKEIADRARPRLQNCFDLLVREAAPRDAEELLTFLLAAFQSMPLNLADLPPMDEGGLYKHGFSTPTQTLRAGKADCDSSSDALCALWQDPDPQILLLRVPMPEEEKKKLPPRVQIDEHVLLGVEAYPGTDQAVVQFGLRSFVLCETVRPAGLGALLLSQTLLPAIPAADSAVCMTRDCFSAPDRDPGAPWEGLSRLDGKIGAPRSHSRVEALLPP